MHTLKRTIGCGAGLALMMIMTLVGTTNAFASGGGTLTPTISASGDFSVNNVGALPTLSAALDGTAKTMAFDLPLQVTDVRGTGAGWTLTASATQFAMLSGTGSTSVLHTLPPSMAFNSLSTPVCNVASTCTVPNNTDSIGAIGAATALNTNGVISYNTDGAPIAFLNARVDSGQGVINLTPNFTQTVPATTYAGSYSGSLTIAATTGP